MANEVKKSADMFTFINGHYYTVKEASKWGINVKGGLGDIFCDIVFLRPDRKLLYQDGKLFIAEDSFIPTADEHIEAFTPWYSNEQLEEWDKLRKQYAGQAMQSLMGRTYMKESKPIEVFDYYGPDDVARKAFEFADAMINVLKETA